MSAPEGNQFWKLRSKHGRIDSLPMRKLFGKTPCEYFQWVDENPWMESKPMVVSHGMASRIKRGNDSNTGKKDRIPF